MRPRLLVGLGVVIAALFMSACLVWRHEPHYRPLTHDASSRVRGTRCQGAAGPPAILEIRGPRDVKLGAEIRRWDDGLEARLGLSPGASFASGTFVFENVATGERQPGTVPQRWPSGWYILPGVPMTRLLHVAAFQPQGVRLYLPNVEVIATGETVQFGPIEFRYRPSDFGLYPMNC